MREVYECKQGYFSTLSMANTIQWNADLSAQMLCFIECSENLKKGELLRFEQSILIFLHRKTRIFFWSSTWSYFYHIYEKFSIENSVWFFYDGFIFHLCNLFSWLDASCMPTPPLPVKSETTPKVGKSITFASSLTCKLRVVKMKSKPRRYYPPVSRQRKSYFPNKNTNTRHSSTRASISLCNRWCNDVREWQ